MEPIPRIRRHQSPALQAHRNMLIGLLSDSHSNTSRLEAGVSLLVEQGAEAIVHCGDIVAIDHVAMLADREAQGYLVAGNMDRHPAKLAHAATACGVTFAADFVNVPLGDGRFLIALHGDDGALMSELVDGRQFPYVCHGHTHRAAEDKYGQVRVICPGALAHPRSPKYPTVATLDTESDTVKFIKVV